MQKSKIKNQKSRSKTLKLLLLFLPFAFCLLPFAKALAQSSRTITVVPPTIEQKLDPGRTAEGSMKVINQTNEPITFKATVQDYIVDNNDGIPHLIPPGTLSGKYSGASWVGVYPDTFTLAPQEKQQLSYYIQTPLDARPGGHYAAIIYTPESTATEKASGAVVTGQIGTLFYITINGPVTENANISKFFTRGLHEFGPVNIQTQIQNNGDLHIKPVGGIILSDIFGKRVDISALEAKNIFPGGVTRNFTNTVGKGFMIGPYKAKLLASYGINSNLPLSATISFFVFPWKLALIIILAIIAIILGFKYIKKKRTPPPPPPTAQIN